jgi:hypothetical protein
MRLFPVAARSTVKNEVQFLSVDKAEVATTIEALSSRLTFVELVTMAEQNRLLMGKDFTGDRLTAGQRVWLDLLGSNPTFANLDHSRFSNVGSAWDSIESRPFVIRKVKPVAPAAETAPTANRRPGAAPQPVPDQVQAEPRPALPKHTQEDFFAHIQAGHCLVIAPPGTGKTHVLVQGLGKIVQAGGFNSEGDEIVVLSFSRAAVGELRTRLSALAESSGLEGLRYVTVRTFDSFVTELLRRDMPADVLRRKSYDDRIRFFVDNLESLPACAERVAAMRYLFVDEVQDLVGVRADLTLKLAGSVVSGGGNAIMLGDPAQAIYDWQVKKDPEATTSAMFLRKISELLAPRVLRFAKSYRFSGGQMEQLSEELREAMGEGERPDSIRVVAALSALPRVQIAVSDLSPLASAGRSVAVLTRDNLEAWQVASWLRAQGIPVEHWRGARGGMWPPWIAVVLRGWAMTQMRVPTFEQRWNDRNCGSADGLASALVLLRALGVLDDDMLDIEAFRRCLLTQAPPATVKGGGIVVSTIHRSKGLEFDHVVVLEPADNRWHGNPEALRVLYVAATRAKKELSFLARDREILRSGKWLPGGHINLYRASDGINRVLLDGGDEVAIRLEPGAPEAEDVAHRLLSTCAGQGRISFVKVDGGYRLAMPGKEGVVPVNRWASHALNRDLKYLEWRYRFKGDLVELRGIECAELATVAIDDEELQQGADGVGRAGVGLVPVFSGLGESIFA